MLNGKSEIKLQFLFQFKTGMQIFYKVKVNCYLIQNLIFKSVFIFYLVHFKIHSTNTDVLAKLEFNI